MAFKVQSNVALKVTTSYLSSFGMGFYTLIPTMSN